VANPNPHAARLARKRRHKPGNLAELLRVLWQALLEAEAVLAEASGNDAELTLKAAHCISQCGGQYAKLLEVGEFESRLKALEDAQYRRNGRVS
jgi:hypothetical protein